MKKVAVIEGGYSKEKAISIKSAKTVFDNLDRTKFEPISQWRLWKLSSLLLEW